ncbi:uncharacterized protein STEHIDRAFT_80936 [Stereum hirsutum FP-91666 SS1]|uniref:uncharacterized protein n=1 Tax=Stereum hirsutum (strain FP-91666) TaxID=721885 RepID=UPI000444A3D7|nr:uncharacterized protein STEHIDRAFT_80936 [Stereum hirsutum FP-91666 SS1]EIM85518.1 hypothetical protein STEHIDRAFT_80936 [Stereum hirsutum FP-91666 SS1]
MGEIADDILTHITSSLTSTSHLALIETILSTRIKQLFRSNPHPSLNMGTGRKLPRPAGGPMASQDVYEDQVWKKEVGVARVIEWCVAGIENDAYERMWFLVVPPTMTLLDDYEIRYKIEGMKIVDAMIKNVPSDLLRRTGVTELLFTTLTRSLTFLHSPDTPALLRAAIPTTISLIKHTTKPQSEARFHQLCALLGDGIIGSIWGYGFSDLESITASVEGLPTIVNELKLGTVRYLKALIPQLTHPLLPNPDKQPSTSLQLASLKALSFVVRECAIRIARWKGVILGPVAKCWVVLVDSGKSGKEVDELKGAMSDICHELAKAVPSAVEDYRKLLQLDMNMFSDLVGDLVSPANGHP